MNIFRAADILEFAVRVEENGQAFYRRAAAGTENKSVKDLFIRLADEEIRHRSLFQEMLSTVGDYAPAETYPGEYVAYLRNYIDGKVIFTGEVQGFSASDTDSALQLAIEREIASILYYQEIKRFVPEKDHRAIDAIVDEERKHFSILTEARQSYASKV